MINNNKHIDKADGAAIASMMSGSSGEGPYAFKTLWQEITNGISAIGNTIINGLQVTEKTDQLHDLYDVKGRQDWSVDVLNATKPNNTGSNILFVIVICVALGALVYVAINKQKKQ